MKTGSARSNNGPPEDVETFGEEVRTIERKVIISVTSYLTLYIIIITRQVTRAPRLSLLIKK